LGAEALPEDPVAATAILLVIGGIFGLIVALDKRDVRRAHNGSRETVVQKSSGRSHGRQGGRDKVVKSASVYEPEPNNAQCMIKKAKTNYFYKINNWIKILTLLFVAAYTVITFNAFVSGSRAFVYFDRVVLDIEDRDVTADTGGAIFNLPGSEGKVVYIRFLLNNSGATATRNLRIVLDCQQLGVKDPRAREPFSVFRWDDAVSVPEIIGPKQTIEIGPCGATFETILNAQIGIVPIYLMGEIRYQDRVVPWAHHVTRFSQQLIITEFSPERGVISAKTRSVGRNNCADEDCPYNGNN
jgi:hypothetical protein